MAFSNGQNVQAADLNNFSVTTVTTSGAITSGGTLTPLGLIDASGASAGQIKFPATQNPSSNANTFDYYRKFDWTPVVTFATPGDLATAYSVQIGKGVKKGIEVTLTGTVTLSTFTHTTAAGSLIITGNPYTATNSTGLTQPGACIWQGITKANYTNVVASIAANSQNIVFAISGSGQTIAVVSSGDTPTGGALSLAFTLTFYATE